jgi:hypothetical protein
MAYAARRTRLVKARSGGRAELLYLFVVLFAGVATAWWAGHKLGPDLSIISTVASAFGIGDTSPAAHAAVGYTSAGAEAAAQPRTSDSAGFCAAGATPTYASDFTTLKDAVGEQMGTPIECAHTAATNEDTIQLTTTGLAVYDPTTNTASFTDGWRHWAITPHGLMTWEGMDPNPPTG